MGIFAEIRNERLIRELQRELNTDVVLFGVDGFAYFGNLQAIEDCRIAVLAPAIKARTDFVEILGPSEVVLEQAFSRVDLWAVVGKATAISTDPIHQSIASDTNTAARTETLQRQESHLLIRQLCCSIGDEVAITTLGGFWFEGIVSTVEDELAVLTAETIVIPGKSTELSGIRSVVVNLEAITSVSGC